MKNNAVEISKEEFHTTLGEIGLPELISLPVESTLVEVLNTLQKNKMGSVTLEKEGKLCGIITERDFLMKVVGKFENWEGLSAEEFMTHNPFTLDLNNKVIHAIRIMSKKEFRHLPIVDEAGKAVHMISIKDLLKIMIDFFPGKIKKQGVVVDWNFVQVDDYDENFLSSGRKKGALSENLFLLPLKRIIDKPSLMIDKETSLQEVVQIMQARGVGSILLTEFETILKGIFTERDFLFKVLGKYDLSQPIPISDFMTTNPHTLLSKHYLAHAINNMFHFKYRNTIIVNEDTYPISVISLLEIFKFIAGYLFEDEEEKGTALVGDIVLD